MTTAGQPLAPVQMPRPAVRAVVSLLVALHVFGRVSRPVGDAAAASQLAADVARVFQPYLDALSLANGYRFFAPEPGPSHLVRYEVTLADGTLKTGEFPDRQVSTSRGCSIIAISCSASSSTRSAARTPPASAPRPMPRAMPNTWPTQYDAQDR